MISISFLSPFTNYDVARFGGYDYWAGEYFPGAAGFAAGAGPGLFRKKVGKGGAPVAVTGSNSRRFYALSTLLRDDGVELLVSIGVKVSDLFAMGYETPRVWSLMTPNPLYLFTSTDGVTWTDYSLGNIEKGDGPYTTYGPGEEEVFHADSINNAWQNPDLKFANGISSEGTKVLWIATGRHLIEFDGVAPVITPLNGAAGKLYNSLAVAQGQFFIVDGYTTSLSVADGVVTYAKESVFTGGVDIVQRPVLYQPPASNPIHLDEPIGESPFEVENGYVLGFGRYKGMWLFWFRVEVEDEDAQVIGLWKTAQLPEKIDNATPEQIANSTVDISELPQVQIADVGSYFDLGQSDASAETIVNRGASGRAYMIQRHDMQDPAAQTKAQIAVLETLVDPRISDFYVDSGTGVTCEPGIMWLGTDDGYIIRYRPLDGHIAVVAQLGGPVKHIGTACACEIFAMTPSAMWWSGDRETFTSIYSAAAGYTLNWFRATVCLSFPTTASTAKSPSTTSAARNQLSNKRTTTTAYLPMSPSVRTAHWW
jgi:hypothetical protein